MTELVLRGRQFSRNNSRRSICWKASWSDIDVKRVSVGSRSCRRRLIAFSFPEVLCAAVMARKYVCPHRFNSGGALKPSVLGQNFDASFTKFSSHQECQISSTSHRHSHTRWILVHEECSFAPPPKDVCHNISALPCYLALHTLALRSNA